MGKKVRLLIPEKRIRKRVKELAEQISKDYQKKELDLIVVLKGGFLFGAELMRYLKIPLRVHFLAAKSYIGKTSSEKVEIHFLEKKEIKGKNILIIEDILETGLTLKKIIKYLKSFSPKEIKTCVLLEKEVSTNETIKVNYLGFKIGNKFVVGYGMDFEEQFRNLSYIGYI